jgi:hypothetical protein
MKTVGGDNLYRHFELQITTNQIKIINKAKATTFNITIYMNNNCIGNLANFNEISFNYKLISPSVLTIHAFSYVNGHLCPFRESFLLDAQKDKNMYREQVNYKPGDILVGCDNINGLPVGYMGHAALVVDEEHIIEAVMTDPIVRKVPIENFKRNHPNHAHFRPTSEKVGNDVSQYAEKYLKTFQENKQNGIAQPIFYFTVKTPLDDEWTYIYCSKLVWLSYYYGANYSFHNDHLWFSPEDLYANMKDNPDFELIYIHPNYGFHIDI